MAGSLALTGVRQLSPMLVAVHAVEVVVALVLLRALATDGGTRRDEALISAIAIVGRGMLLAVLAHLGLTDARWSAPASAAVLAGIAAVVLGQAAAMARRGPLSRLRVPSGWERPVPVETSPLVGASGD